MMRCIQTLALWIRQRPALSRRVLRLVPDLPISVRVGPLGSFRIGLRTQRSLWLRDPWAFERAPMLALRTLIDPGDVVYDVGANIGLYARYLVRELHARLVIAFEPWVRNRRLFLDNARRGGIESRVRLLPYAVADFDHQAAFQVDDMQSTSGTLDAVQRGQASTGRSSVGLPPLLTRVDCRSLDSLLADGLEIPRVLKLDIEGAEDLALKGARRLLADHRPHLLIELHGADVARRVLAATLEHGYSCRGFGAPSIHSTGYGAFDGSHLASIRGQYDLHFLVASRDVSRLALLDSTMAPGDGSI